MTVVRRRDGGGWIGSRLFLRMWLCFGSGFAVLPALAEPVLDQAHALTESASGTVAYQGIELAQTFTVGHSGLLTQVALTLGQESGATGDVHVEVRSTHFGMPRSGAPLYETTIPSASIPPRGGHGYAFVPVRIRDANVYVAKYDVLALVVSRSAPPDEPAVLWESGLPSYEPGQRLSRLGNNPWFVNPGTYDYGFQSWVDPSFVSFGPQIQPGDFDGNGHTDSSDYVAWRDHLGATIVTDAAGNGDGTINQADYNIWRQAYGSGSAAAAHVSPPTSVPEPGSGLLAWLMFTLLLSRRHVAHQFQRFASRGACKRAIRLATGADCLTIIR